MTVSRAVTGRCIGGFVLLNMHLAAGLPTVEDAQVSTLLSTDDGCLLSRVGVVTTDDLSGKLIQVRKNGFRSTTLKPKSSSQENILQHRIPSTILYTVQIVQLPGNRLCQ